MWRWSRANCGDRILFYFRFPGSALILWVGCSKNGGLYGAENLAARLAYMDAQLDIFVQDLRMQRPIYMKTLLLSQSSVPL